MDTEKKNKQPNQETKNKTTKFWIFLSVGVLAIILVLFVAVTSLWYQASLQPVSKNSKQIVRFEIKQGEGNARIAENLEKSHLINSAFAMVLYLRFNDKPASLQAGTYALSPKMSLDQIVSHLASGKTDVFMVTILPGRTLSEIKKDLQKYGYSSSEVEDAYKASYNNSLLADKPANADLEGYIFPETFEMNTSDRLQKLFSRSFDTLYGRLSSNGLIDKFKAEGLNLHQALTLASIVQKEASKPSDQPQVAQVFLLRFKQGMKLESDVTFHYAAKKLGVTPRVDLNSPYNTRLVSGLPPTPISNMNYSALNAVANPASGDYLYFIAGDNSKIYYAHTIEEHQQNIKNYCQKLCGNAY